MIVSLNETRCHVDTTYAVSHMLLFAAVLPLLFVVSFSLAERKSKNSLNDVYLAAAGKMATETPIA
jgi:hypothetical protein